jgi:TRAP-type mannitol/chloroaromatic compound transport system substrate-binding protein
LTGALSGTAAGLVGAAAIGVFRGGDAGAGGPAVHTGGRVKWRLASSFPESLDTIYGAAEVLAERVAAMSGGRFEIRPYQAGELVPALQVLDAVQKGSVEVGQTGGYYYIGKHPAMAFDTTVPFGFTPRQQTAWLLEAGGIDLMRELYAEFDCINFPCGNTGVQMGGWFKPEVNSLSDLAGLRMRIPGFGGKVMDALGVSVQVISGGEIYAALERGAIDGTEWVGPYDDEKLGFWQVAKNYYYPGWWEPGPSLSFLVGRAAWEKLPVAYREIFQTASAEAATAMQARYDAKNPAALKRLLDRGVVMRPFADDIMRGARQAAEDMLDDGARSNKAYARILEHWRAFREDSFRWFSTAELAYARFTFPG